MGVASIGVPGGYDIGFQFVANLAVICSVHFRTGKCTRMDKSVTVT